MKELSKWKLLLLYVLGITITLAGCQQVHLSPAQEAVRVKTSTKQDILKMDGPERFLAYHQAIRTNAGKIYPDYQTGYRIREQTKAWNLQQKSKKRSAVLPWIERGPGNVGGRTRGIWVDPSDTSHQTLFAGSVGGGIWKTEDAGENWENLTPQFPNLATATIAGSPANSQIIYAGTGEGFGASRNILGDGIWKTVDAGDSWQQLSSTAGRIDIAAVYRIIVNPDNADELLFCTLSNPRLPNFADPVSNIFKSTDGGNSIVSVHSSTRAVQQLVADPNDFNRLYATVNGRGVMRSTDGGLTWRYIYETTEYGRLELTIAPSNPRHIFVAAQSDPPENAADQNTSHLLYSVNAGANWYEVVGKDNQNDFGDWFSGQGWYDNTVAVHPFDSQTVFVGGAGSILKISIESFDRRGAQYLATMQPVTDGYGEYILRYPEARGKGVHVDHHNLILIPRDSASQLFYMIDGNDGGVAYSKDQGKTFLQTGDTFKSECLDIECRQIVSYQTAKGYNTSQFYGVDKKNGQDRYVAGAQDNGSWVSPVDPASSSDWRSAPSGDGFEAVWHFTKTNQLVESSQFNNLFRSDNEGISWRRLNVPGDGPFLSRVAGSQQDPDLIFGVSEQGVIKSFDFGDHWQTIEMPVGWRFEGLATPIKIALANPNVVWTGSGLRENAQVALSTDGGTTFELIPRYEGATLGLITNIATHPLKDSTVFFLFSQANGPKIVRSTDMGATLEDISGFVTNQEESTNGFPDVATYSLLIMPYDDNILWAGTEIGLFESTNGGSSWAMTNNGLPNVAIWDMKIVNNEVVLATHGRGIWTVELPELNNYEPLAVEFLAPQILLNEAIFAGRISGKIFLRSPADSSELTLSYQGDTRQVIIKETIPANFRDTVIELDEILVGISGEDFVEVTATITSFFGEKKLRAFAQELIHAVDTIPIFNYFTDFDDGKRDFALMDWKINHPDNLEGISLNSPHPYPNLDESMAIFKKPILVTQSTMVDLDEIVLVEPGTTDTFPSDDFFDYCQIEATADFGRNWQTIAAYDSREEAVWMQAYDQDPFTASNSLYVHRTFSLNEFFDAGDTVYLRFNLVSDPRLEGWGWNIDNFEVNGEVTPVFQSGSNQLSFELLGNPVSDDLIVNWQSKQPVNVTITIVSMAGHRLLTEKITIIDREISSWNVGNWPSGTYYLMVQDGPDICAIKWIKL